MRSFDILDVFYGDSADKQWVAIFDDGEITNVDIVQEELVLHESLCASETLQFGSCESSYIQIRVANVLNSMLGKTLSLFCNVGGSALLVGIYTVDEDIRSADRTYRDITAHDAMFGLLNEDVTDWYNGLTFPLTMREFRNSFFTRIGITQDTMSLVNDNISIQKTLSGKITGADVIIPLCELNGVFGHVTPIGTFTYVTLEHMSDLLLPSNSLNPSDDLFPKDVGAFIPASCGIEGDYSDFFTQAITKVVARIGGVDISSGTDGNTYTVVENPFLLSLDAATQQTVVNNLCGKVQGYYYQPYEIAVVGNPCIEVGDRITMNWRNGIIKSYVLERELRGVQSLRDTLSAEGKELYPTEINNFASSIKMLNNKTNRLERTTEETLSEIADLDRDLRSEISQTAEAISAKVSLGTEYSGIKIESGKVTIDGSKGGKFVVNMSNFSVDENGNISILGSLETTGDYGMRRTVVDQGMVSLTSGDNRSSIDGREIRMVHIGALDDEGITITLSTTEGSKVSANVIEAAHAIRCGGYAVWTKGEQVAAATAAGLSGSPSIDVTNVTANGRIKCQDWYSNSQSSYEANAYITSNGYIRRKESSSERYKEDITDTIPKELDPHGLYNIPVKAYRYRKGILDEKDQRADAMHIGFIAEDVAREYPIACDMQNGKPEVWNAMYMIPAMLKLMQEQNEHIIALERRIEDLEQSVYKNKLAE